MSNYRDETEKRNRRRRNIRKEKTKHITLKQSGRGSKPVFQPLSKQKDVGLPTTNSMKLEMHMSLGRTAALYNLHCMKMCSLVWTSTSPHGCYDSL